MRREAGIVLGLEPSPERGGALRLSDLGKYLEDAADAFTELTAHHAPELSEVMDWELTQASTNSPLTMVIQPIATSPDVVLPKHRKIVGFVRLSLEKARSALERSRRADISSDNAASFAALKKLLKPLAAGDFARVRIGAQDEDGEEAVLDVGRETASSWMAFIESLNRKADDFEWREIGSIIGRMVDAHPYYGKPAFRVIDDTTGAKVVCTVPENLADEIGRAHTLEEIWQEARLMVAGTVTRKEGKPYILAVERVARLPEDDDPESLIAALRQGNNSATEDDREASWGQRLWGADA